MSYVFKTRKNVGFLAYIFLSALITLGSIIHQIDSSFRYCNHSSLPEKWYNLPGDWFKSNVFLLPPVYPAPTQPPPPHRQILGARSLNLTYCFYILFQYSLATVVFTFLSPTFLASFSNSHISLLLLN